MSVLTTGPSEGFDDYRGNQIIACGAVFVAACTLAVALRFYAVHISGRSRFLEDWLMLPALVLMIGICVDIFFCVSHGGAGRHEAYNIQVDPTRLESFAKTLLAVEILYGLCIPTEKTAILLLYLRLFRVHSWFRYTIYFLIAFIWAWGTIGGIVAIFACKPIEFQWTRKGEGSCFNELAFYRWICVPNVIHDILLLILPIPSVYKLQIPLRQKLALCTIFLIGSIGCVASFIRTNYFFQIKSMSDLTWHSVELMGWTIAEPGLILICACMPSLWPLLKKVPFFVSRVETAHKGNTTGGTVCSGTGGDRKMWTNYRQRHGEFIPLHGVEDRIQTDDEERVVSTGPAIY